VIGRRHIAGAIALGAATVGCGAARPDNHGPARALRHATPTVRHVVTGDNVRARRATRRARQRAARRKAGYLTTSSRGRKWLPAVEVRPGSTLSWSNSGSFFQVYDQHDVVAVTSIAHCGVAALPAGRERLKVNAAGHWTIRISPATMQPAQC
jgi:hypothetical protein